MKNAYKILLCLMIINFILACDNSHKNIPESNLVQKGKNISIKAEGEYFGQTPPDIYSEMFAPGIVSTYNDETNSFFTSDGNEFYYTLRTSGSHYKIMHMKKIKNKWCNPQRAWFSNEESRNIDIAISNDMKKILFVSDRPTFKYDSINDYNIWEINFTTDGWDEPKPLDINNNSNFLYPTIANNGNIYFFSDFNQISSGLDIFKSEYKNGKYQKPKMLNEAINTIYHDFDPFISPDESFLIFASTRADSINSNLYITYNLGNGNWSNAIKFNKNVNSNNDEFAPYLSYDGKYLFFTSNTDSIYQNANYKNRKYLNFAGNVFWVNSKVISQLKKEII